MTRTIVIIMIMLAVALALEIAILPVFLSLRGWMALWFDGRSLLPLVGILVGLLRGEMQGMLVALVAACLFGFSQPPGQLGVSIDSYVVTAFAAGMLARMVQLYSPSTRGIVILSLLVLERVVWWTLRLCFRWEATPFLEFFQLHISWPALVLTALLGSYLYRRLSPKMRLWLYMDS